MVVAKQITVTLEHGLHAKPAQYFVQKANDFVSDIKIVKHSRNVDAKSILGLLSLGIRNGAVITIKADGSDEREAVETLTAILKGDI